MNHSRSLPMEIKVSGISLLLGDEASCNVIFNNLSGRNSNDSPSWRNTTFEDYRAMMELEFSTKLPMGAELSLHHRHNDGMTRVKASTIGGEYQKARVPC